MDGVEEIRKVAEDNGEEDRDTVFHIFQQLGMVLQKGNAAIFVCRMETVYKMVNRGEVKLGKKSRIKITTGIKPVNASLHFTCNKMG